MAGAVGLKASIKELLAWGVAHIPNNGKALNGSQELAEAIRVATQVERGENHPLAWLDLMSVFYCFLFADPALLRRGEIGPQSGLGVGGAKCSGGGGRRRRPFHFQGWSGDVLHLFVA